MGINNDFQRGVGREIPNLFLPFPSPSCLAHPQIKNTQRSRDTATGRNLVWRARNSQKTSELLLFLFSVEFHLFQRKQRINKPLPKCTELPNHTEKKYIFNFAFSSSPNFWGVFLRGMCSEDRNCVKDSWRSQDEGQSYRTCYLLQWECSLFPPKVHVFETWCPVWACWECLGLWEMEPNIMWLIHYWQSF